MSALRRDTLKRSMKLAGKSASEIAYECASMRSPEITARLKTLRSLITKAASQAADDYSTAREVGDTLTQQVFQKVEDLLDEARNLLFKTE